MTLDKFDTIMKEKFKDDVQELPGLVRDRVDQTLLDLPEKGRGIRARVQTYASIAVALFALVVAFGAFSPQVAIALNQHELAESLEELAIVKSVQSVFNLKTTMTRSEFVISGVGNLKKAYDDGAFTKVGQVAEDRGLTVEITEVLFDGVSISIGYIISSEDNFNELGSQMLKQSEDIGIFMDTDNYRDELKNLKSKMESLTLIDGTINGEPIGLGGSASGDFVDANHFAGVQTVTAGLEGFPDIDAFQLDFKVRKIGHYGGSWPFTIDVVRNDSHSIVYEVGQEVTYEGTTLIVDKITFSPSAVEVIWRSVNKSLTTIVMYDDQGWPLHGRSSNAIIERDEDGNHLETFVRSRFKPVEELPEFITLQPENFHTGQPIEGLTEGLKMKLILE